MRISSVKEHPWYTPNWYKYIVYLNEKMLKHCIIASEEEGEAVIYKVDKLGNLIIKNNELVREKVKGSIKVELI